jgi:signal transduction histidine kinase
VRAWLRSKPITVRITAGFVCAMAVLLLATGVFIYQRVQFALDRSIRDDSGSPRAEIDARRRHRDEALRELLMQLGAAFGGTLVVAGYAGYRTARAALDPVERMRDQASGGVLDDDFRLTVPDTDDELSRLATTLNALLGRLQDAAARERQLLADASHELRTPLAHLQMEIDLALSRERTREELQVALRHLRSETERLTRLANDLLLIARAGGGQLPLRRTQVDLAEIAEQARARFAGAAAAADRRIDLDIRDGARVVADPDRLSQALDNLIDNALRYGAGTITVRCLPNGGKHVAIHVLDLGPGFPADFVARAFDRFATASSSRTNDGTGLGLAIVEAIVLSHGGRVGAANREAGADVWLELPI